MMVYRKSIHSVKKYSPAHVVLGFPLFLPIDCIYRKPHTEIYATPSDYVFTMKKKLQETDQLMREQMDSNKNARRPIMIAVGIERAIRLAKKC